MSAAPIPSWVSPVVDTALASLAVAGVGGWVYTGITTCEHLGEALTVMLALGGAAAIWNSAVLLVEREKARERM